MISRRALFGTGAAGLALAGVGIAGDRAHKLDDWARKVGVDPRRRPALADEALIKAVRSDQTVLLLSTQAISTRQPGLATTMKPLTANTRKQLDNLGGPVANVDISAPPASPKTALDAVIDLYARAEKNRSREALEAVSGEFAQVLASISASLAQSLVVLGDARKAL